MATLLLTLAAPVAGAATAVGLTAAGAGSLLTGLSAVSSIRQGQAQENVSKIQAQTVQSNAKNREISRRQRLVESLASQNATRAASGIQFFEGSSKAIALEDIRQAKGESLQERAGAGAQSRALLAGGRVSRRTGVLGAGSSLLAGARRESLRG